MRLYRSHGVSRPDTQSKQLTKAPWIYEQTQLGYNYRMTDIHAALGLSQMQRLDEFILRRRQIAQRYDEQLRDLPFTLPIQEKHGQSALHLYPVLVSETDAMESVRLSLYEFLHHNELGVNVHYVPVHTQPYYQQLGFRKGDFPVAEHYYSRTLSLPIFGSMTEEQQCRVVKLLHDFCDGNASKFAA